jgi:CRP/FNR family cyclic AMP-dependent transcriptional regulator
MPGPEGGGSCLRSSFERWRRAPARSENYTKTMTTNASKSASREAQEPVVTVAALREIALFGALSDEVVERLARSLKVARAMAGDPIFREGDTVAREMYVVLEGEIEVTKRSRRGRDVRVAILGPNDCFGEMSMIDMQSRSATVRALAPSRLLTVTSEDMDALYRSDLKSYALIVLNIARDLSRRLRVTDGILADFAVNVLDEYVSARRA